MTIKKIRPSFAFTEERLAQLQEVIPEAFSDGKINWDVLREALGAHLEDDDAETEHFGLFWPGKREARRIAALPSRGTLVPAPGEGVNEDTTRNLFVEGDNLEVLKLLQKSYAGRVKLIYIDPPYNTGNDFIYDDDFTDPLGDYLRRTRQADEKGEPLSTNTKADGRFHSNWLSMMYPRLRLARSLLRDDGFFVVSIDDAEMNHLRLLLNEIFGEENFLATIVWDRNRKNDARFFSIGHEYMLVYARAKDYLIDNDVVLRAPKEGVEEVREEWIRLRRLHKDDWTKVRAELRGFYEKLSDDDPKKPLARFNKVDEKGPYRDDGDASWPGGGGPRYTVLHPLTRKPCKIPRRGWVYPTIERMQEKIAEGIVVFGPDETYVPKIRANLFDRVDQVLRSVRFSYAQTAAQQFDAIFDGVRVFDNPKPFNDLSDLISYLTGPDDLVMDFFAGSASFGHACFEANRKEHANRRFICVQLPEPVNIKEHSGENALRLGLKTIADIGKERLRRIGAKLRNDGAKKVGEDVGFRVLRLCPSHFRVWEDYQGTALRELQSLFDAAQNPLVEGWAHEALLTEVLLIEGFPLDSSVQLLGETKGNRVHVVRSENNTHRLLICLDKKVKEQAVVPIEFQEQDVLVCVDNALSDQLKLQLADRCMLKTI